MSRCDFCKYYDECEFADYYNFCDDCKYGDDCTIRTVSCERGYDIECNNGFEDKDILEDDEDDFGEDGEDEDEEI